MGSRHGKEGHPRQLVFVVLLVATLALAVIIWVLVGRSSNPTPSADCGPGGCADRTTAVVVDAPDPRFGPRARQIPSGAVPEEEPDEDAAPVEEEPLICRRPRDCVFAVNYNVCCPCTIAMIREIVARNDCIFPAEGAPPRPEECGLGCHPDVCVGCPAEPQSLDCRNGQCVTLYAGECIPGEPSCGDGMVCQFVDGEARCVEDPDECDDDSDCRQRGYECRDWDGAGIRVCWHPESTCRMSMACPYHFFCEDPDGDGVYECVDGGADCRPQLADVECGQGQSCDDPDGDGRGTCVDP